MPIKPVPEGNEGLIPSLIVRDANKAIDFYRQLFGATEVMRMPSPDGKTLMHAEIRIGKDLMMLSDENPQWGAYAPEVKEDRQAPTSLMIYLPDVDAIFQKAISLGAKPIMPPADMFWGDRFGKFVDPFGHSWAIATHIEDVSPEECAKRAEKFMTPGGCDEKK